MISPFAFDALLAGAASGNVPPPPSSLSGPPQSPSSTQQSNQQNGGLFIGPENGGDGNGRRKRKLSPAETATGQKERISSPQHNSNDLIEHSSSFGPNGLFSLVEQQLAASSPNAIFQQTIFGTGATQKDAKEEEIEQQKEEWEQRKEQQQQCLVEDVAATMGTMAEQSTNVGQQQQMMEFLEAQKAFQKLFSGFDQQQRPQSQMVNPLLAKISPFLLAIQSQQHFATSTFFPQTQLDPSTFFGHHSLLHSLNSNQQASAHLEVLEEDGTEQLQHDDERDEADSEGTTTARHQQRTAEPEDLSIKGLRTAAEEDCSSDRGSVGRNTGSRCETQQPMWNYEEQFKQLYDINDELGRKEWLDDWLLFMHRIGKPITRIPIMAKQVLDLFELYKLVVNHGGLVEVINKKLWREITKGLNLPNSITSAAFTLRSQYTRYLYDYECHQHNFSTHTELTVAVDGNKRDGRHPPTGSGGGSTPSAAATSVSIITPAAGHQYRSSSSSTTIDQQQFNTAAAQMMAAALSSAPPGTFPTGFPALPPPSSMAAAAFFGKQLVNFGTTPREADQMKHAFQQQFGLQLDSPDFGGITNSENFFPRLDIADNSTKNEEQIGNENGEEQCRKMIGKQKTPPPSSAINENSSKNHKNHHSHQQSSTTTSGPTIKRRRLENYPISGKGNNRGGETAAEEEQQPTMNTNNFSIQFGGKDYQQTPSNSTAAVDLSSASNIVGTSLGPFDQLLKNATRCSMNMNVIPKTMLNGTTESSSNANASGSMVVSMELNGVLYQGVLFAIPNSGDQVDDNSGNSNDSPPNSLSPRIASQSQHSYSISTANDQREVEAN